jgi:uncharacterized protein (TIGR04255 family)
MAKRRHLPRPPITEAVLDARVTFAAPLAPEALQAVATSILGYENPSPILAPQFLFAAPVVSPAVNLPQFQMGFSVKSQDGLFVAQFRPDGLSISRLPPYTEWEDLFDQMWQLWVAYRDSVHPDRVRRVSARFINRIDIPAGRDLDDFLSVAPRLPKGAPDFLSTFTTAVVIPYPKEKTQAVMRLASQFTPTSTEAPVVLDFDILRECDLDPADDTAIKAAIGALRPIKNQLFFGSVTEQSMELFQ